MIRNDADRGPLGRSIVIVGPDGAGKSALAAALVERLGGPDRVDHVHLRTPILPRRTRHTGPVTEPHAQVPYGPMASAAKVSWLFVDMQAMWRIVVPWTVRRGRDVVVERGWWDLAVDPRRYRLREGDAPRRLAGLFPSPDLEIVLTGPGRVLAARKPELPVEEIDRQSHAWRAFRPAGPGVLHLDADRSLDDLIEAVMAHPVIRGPVDGVVAAVRTDRQRVDRWVRLPPGPNATWYIPRSPRSAAHAGLRVYQPTTRRAAIGWWAARVVAALGGFRLLPGYPAPEAVGLVADVSPPDAIHAVSIGHRTDRATVLVLDREGRSLALAKTATDDVGRARLAHEADCGAVMRHALTPPLSSPRLMRRGDGFLLFEAVDWTPRRDAWRLPEEVAAAIGRFYRAGTTDDGATGYTHGDLAPWNLLRTVDGWSLVDWADARTDGPPFYDVLHYLVQAHALLGRPTRDDLVDGLHGHGPVAAIIAAYADGAGLDARDALAHLPAYLDASERWLAPGADRGRGEAARAGLRMAVGPPRS